MSKLVNGQNYFNEMSLNEACELLEQGTEIQMYIDVTGHTRNNMTQEEYKEALESKYGNKLISEITKGAYSYHYSYKLGD